MKAICVNCETTVVIDDSEIPECGYSIRWECSNCGAASYIKRDRFGDGFNVRFDSLSLLKVAMPDHVLENRPFIGPYPRHVSGLFSSDPWFDECFDTLFGYTKKQNIT